MEMPTVCRCYVGVNHCMCRVQKEIVQKEKREITLTFHQVFGCIVNRSIRSIIQQ